MQNVTVRDGDSLLAHIFEIPDEVRIRSASYLYTLLTRSSG